MQQNELIRKVNDEWNSPLRKLANASNPPSSNPLAGVYDFSLPISNSNLETDDLLSLANTVESYNETGDEILARLLLLTISGKDTSVNNKISAVVKKFTESGVTLPQHFLELSQKPSERNLTLSLFQIGLDKKYELSTRIEAWMMLVGKDHHMDSSQLVSALTQLNEEFIENPEKTIELAKLLVVDLTPRREQQNIPPYSTANSEVAGAIFPILKNVVNEWLKKADMESTVETGFLLDGGTFLHNALLLFHKHRTTKDQIKNLLVEITPIIKMLENRAGNTRVVNQIIESIIYFSTH